MGGESRAAPSPPGTPWEEGREELPPIERVQTRDRLCPTTLLLLSNDTRTYDSVTGGGAYGCREIPKIFFMYPPF
jgi:hypothetical protein